MCVAVYRNTQFQFSAQGTFEFPFQNFFYFKQFPPSEFYIAILFKLN